jgi:general secretion pathway protein A
MYTSFFGLADKPFAITPDPRYLYLSARHAEALAHLLYAIDDAGGFVQLTGEVGTGKTTVVRSLLAQVPAHADVALILNPRVTPSEFMQAICDELHLWVPEPARGSVKAQVDILNHYLLDAHARGRRVVVIVDEAQQLSTEVLEQVRLLTNLETATRKLLQIILVGQPELREIVNRPELRQLAQRITGRYHLLPLSAEETAAYVRHRLQVAGATSEIFSAAALRELHRLAQGIPRIINVIADRALLGAFTRDQHRVTPMLVRRAAGEVFGHPLAAPWVWWATAVAGVAGALLIGAGLWQFARLARQPAAPAVATTPAVVAPATAAVPVPKKPDLPAFLAEHAADAGTDPAFATLLGLWHAGFGAGLGRPCEQAEAQGLQCLAQKGTLAQLRQVNRPAIVALVDDSGREHQMVLTALSDSEAELAIGDNRISVPLADLARYWYGDFLILWRPPLAQAQPLSQGMRGAGVAWLRSALARAAGSEAPARPSDLYDAALAREVEDFQRRHHLTVDGIAGTQTQVLVDALTATGDAPTLHAGGA